MITKFDCDWPATAVQDAENPGKGTCGSTPSLHICSLVLQDPCQVSKKYSIIAKVHFNSYTQDTSDLS